MKKLLLFLTLLSVHTLRAQEIKIIKLKQKPLLYSPENYHVTGVVDDRKDTTNIGFMRAGLFNKTTTINLDHGAASALNQFIQNNTRQDAGTAPIELHITQLNISEKPNTLSEQADLAIAVAFYEDGNKLVEYTASSYAKTTKDASVYIESMIRQRTEELLKQFDEWKGQNVTVAGVHTEVEILKQTDNEDQIFYDANHPVVLDDFKGTPDDLSIGAAATYSGIGMKYTHQKKGASVAISAQVYAYFDRTKSWCRASAKNAKTLNHEQMHFNITAIKCYELAEAIKSYNFSPDNYLKELDNLLRQYDKETGKVQQQYDKETKHGLIKEQQAKWDTDIKARLTDLKI